MQSTHEYQRSSLNRSNVGCAEAFTWPNSKTCIPHWHNCEAIRQLDGKEYSGKNDLVDCNK